MKAIYNVMNKKKSGSVESCGLKGLLLNERTNERVRSVLFYDFDDLFCN